MLVNVLGSFYIVLFLLLGCVTPLTNEKNVLVMYDKNNLEKVETISSSFRNMGFTVKTFMLKNHDQDVPLITDFNGPAFKVVCLMTNNFSIINKDTLADIMNHISYVPWRKYSDLGNESQYDPVGFLLFINKKEKSLENFLSLIKTEIIPVKSLRGNLSINMIPDITRNILNIKEYPSYTIDSSICLHHINNRKNPLNYSIDFIRAPTSRNENGDALNYCSIGLGIQEPNTNNRFVIFGNNEIVRSSVEKDDNSTLLLQRVVEWVSHERNIVRIKNLQFLPIRETPINPDDDPKRFYTTDNVEVVLSLEASSNVEGNGMKWVPFVIEGNKGKLEMEVRFLDNRKTISLLPVNNVDGEYLGVFQNFSDNMDNTEPREKRQGVYEFDINLLYPGYTVIHLEKTLTLYPNIVLFETGKELYPFFFSFGICLIAALCCAIGIAFSSQPSSSSSSLEGNKDNKEDDNDK